VVELLRRADAVLSRDDSRLRALAVASLSRALELAGGGAEAVERGAEALAMARRLLVEFARLVEQRHQPMWRYHLLYLRHVHAFLAGELDLAGQLLEEAGELDQTFGWGLEGVHALGMFLIRREQGRLDGLVREGCSSGSRHVSAPPTGCWGCSRPSRDGPRMRSSGTPAPSS
jgi:hypothetical protein